MFFQHAAEPQFRQLVEQVVGRPVTAFMSAIDTHTDTAAEVFMLGDGETFDDAA